MNSRAGYHRTVPVELTLYPGDVNTIKFGAIGSAGMPILYFHRALLPAFCVFDAYSLLLDFEIHLDGLEIFEDA
jgi:hypothetical protein